jgi:4-hydroxybenzoate polyprenyltransferase
VSSASARYAARTAVAPHALTVLEAMRPKHWIKNAFVLAGVVFAGKVLDIRSVAQAFLAVIAFCLASGATYLVNDVRDLELDRLDPRTATRPAARGAISAQAALAAGAAAACGGLAIASSVNDWLFACVAAYLVLQAAYTAKLKDVVAVDVLVIAAGFVLRATAGGLAIGVSVTAWLLIATALLAALLGLAKRRGQVAALADGVAARRPVLMRYSLRRLDPAIDVLAGATFVLYVVYAAVGAPSQWMLLTSPFVLFGLLRVRATTRKASVRAYEPALLVLRDRALLACVGLWAACAAAIAATAGG